MNSKTIGGGNWKYTVETQLTNTFNYQNKKYDGKLNPQMLTDAIAKAIQKIEDVHDKRKTFMTKGRRSTGLQGRLLIKNRLL